MTALTWTHAQLVDVALGWLAKERDCTVACAEIHGDSPEKPDAIGWRRGESLLVECKASRSDYLADKRKPWRRGPAAGMGMRRFYLAPPELIKPEDLPEGWGLLEVDRRGVHVVVEATARPERDSDAEVSLLLIVIRRMLSPHAWPAKTNYRIRLYGKPLAGGFVDAADGTRTIVEAPEGPRRRGAATEAEIQAALELCSGA